jgi:hypothetical protein
MKYNTVVALVALLLRYAPGGYCWQRANSNGRLQGDVPGRLKAVYSSPKIQATHCAAGFKSLVELKHTAASVTAA